MWNKVINRKLYLRQEKLIAKYEDLKKKYEKTTENWEISMNARIVNNEHLRLYEKMYDICNKKRDIFFEKVKVKICLKSLNLASANEIKEINFHIQLMYDSFVPEDVELEESDIFDYQNDEDPDI